MMVTVCTIEKGKLNGKRLRERPRRIKRKRWRWKLPRRRKLRRQRSRPIQVHLFQLWRKRTQGCHLSK
jgi:hypothetical protein